LLIFYVYNLLIYIILYEQIFIIIIMNNFNAFFLTFIVLIAFTSESRLRQTSIGNTLVSGDNTKYALAKCSSHQIKLISLFYKTMVTSSSTLLLDRTVEILTSHFGHLTQAKLTTSTAAKTFNLECRQMEI